MLIGKGCGTRAAFIRAANVHFLHVSIAMQSRLSGILMGP